VTTSHLRPRRERLLEGALLFTFVMHGLAMLGMAGLLLPMMPGGGTVSDVERIAAIAAHPWRFRLGWLPWQLTAVSDIVLGVALLRARWVPRGPAIVAFFFTIAAVLPDQAAQLAWITVGIDAAQEALRSGDPAPYLALERWMFLGTAAVAATLYTFGGIAWCWCFVRAGTWSKTLSRLSVALYGTFFFISIAPALPISIRPASAVVAVGNALGFVLLELWFALVAEAVLRRARPVSPHGRDAVWRHPWRGPVGRALDSLAGSRFLRALCELTPVVAFKSDIREVVYVNYLVPASRLVGLVPEGLELQRLGPDRDHALFTFLSYNHGHFGPRLLGPLRRLMPSPVQSNWRVHVVDPRTGRRGIYFVTNAITTALHALGARLMSEGMPMHVLEKAFVQRDPDGTVHLSIDPGAGSGPDAEATLRPASEGALPAPWSACFASFQDFLAYCVPQDRAMSTQPWWPRVTRQEIDLGIPLSACERLEGEVVSRAAAAIVGDARPLCFRVPSVSFLFSGEEHDPS
jgi:hypothetical protein